MNWKSTRTCLGGLLALALLAPARSHAQAADPKSDDDEEVAPGAPAPPGPPTLQPPGPPEGSWKLENPAPPAKPEPAKPDAPKPEAKAAAPQNQTPPADEPSAAPASPEAPVANAPTPPPATTQPELVPQPEGDESGPKIKLTGGAPLNDPDVKVHTVQRKTLADKGRSELVFFPAVAQLNGKFTDHLGVAAEYLFHFQENVAFQLTPTFYYVNRESQFNEDLINNARLQAQAATALTMLYSVEAGVEATPIYGKFAFYDRKLASFSVVLNAGVGVAQTRVELRPSNETSGALFGDTGMKLMGNVGGGFRVKVGDHWAVRLEVRDLVYSAAVSSVNGCSDADLANIDTNPGAVGASCKVSKFPTDDKGQHPDANLARALIRTPSSDVLNQVAFYGGVSYVF